MCHVDYWTAGRDSRTYSQFVWESSNNPINSTTAGSFHSFYEIQTCVYYAAGPSFRELDSWPCNVALGILCEIVT